MSDYDEKWPALFERLAAPLREEFGDLAVVVEHVGSTAVPGLPAKPVIDIDASSHRPNRCSRLRRQRDRIVAEAGEDIYGHLEANLDWLVYQFLGKLLPTLYVLRKGG